MTNSQKFLVKAKERIKYESLVAVDMMRLSAALEVALGAFKKQASLCRICEVSGPQHCRSEGCELARVVVAEIERLLA